LISVSALGFLALPNSPLNLSVIFADLSVVPVASVVSVKPVSEPDSLVQDLLNIAEPSFSMAADNEPQQGATESSVEMKSSLNVAGKFKGLLDKVKKPDTKSKAGKVFLLILKLSQEFPELTVQLDLLAQQH
jgi:hypothetical protein